MTFMEKLVPIRDELDVIDQALLGLLADRSKLVEQVGVLKDEYGIGLQASDREAGMFNKLTARAEALGLDPKYVLELWSLIIWNSKISECHVSNRETFMNQNPVPVEDLRRNLLDLTAAVATDYDDYCNGHLTNVQREYRHRESRNFKRSMQSLGMNGRKLAIDLGCANGQVTRFLQAMFEEVHAYDVSPAMISAAHSRQQWTSKVSFSVHDLENGIPEKDNSVSFAIANFGTASELGPNLLPELKRVLRPGGKADLSFYNAEALVNQWFYPWPATVRTRANPWNDTVEVWTNETVYVVQGKSETIKSLNQSCRANGLIPDFWETYPTFGGMLPSVFYEEPMYAGYVESIKRIDEHLGRTKVGDSKPGRVNQGTYIFTSITKPE